MYASAQKVFKHAIKKKNPLQALWKMFKLHCIKYKCKKAAATTQVPWRQAHTEVCTPPAPAGLLSLLSCTEMEVPQLQRAGTITHWSRSAMMAAWLITTIRMLPMCPVAYNGAHAQSQSTSWSRGLSVWRECEKPEFQSWPIKIRMEDDKRRKKTDKEEIWEKVKERPGSKDNSSNCNAWNMYVHLSLCKCLTRSMYKVEKPSVKPSFIIKG